MNMVRVLVADEEDHFRKGVCSLISKNADIEIAGEAASGEEIITLVRKLEPDVLLMNLSMPLIDGAAVINILREENHACKVLFLTQYEDKARIVKGLKAGANGYLTKRATPADLISAIMAVHHGGHFLMPSVTKSIIEDYVRSNENPRSSVRYDRYGRLTPRERMILKLVVEGYKSREIAAMLHISVSTVIGHRTNMMKKLGMHSTAELVRQAITNHWIAVESK